MLREYPQEIDLFIARCCAISARRPCSPPADRLAGLHGAVQAGRKGAEEGQAACGPECPRLPRPRAGAGRPGEMGRDAAAVLVRMDRSGLSPHSRIRSWTRPGALRGIDPHRPEKLRATGDSSGLPLQRRRHDSRGAVEAVAEGVGPGSNRFASKTPARTPPDRRKLREQLLPACARESGLKTDARRMTRPSRQ